MAQIRQFNFEDDDSTYDFNQRNIAAITPGLYRGFDYDATSSGTTLKLKHTDTGFITVKEDLTISGKMGMVKSLQGVEIVETSSISISVVNNSGNAQPRLDIVVMEHEYVDIDGGVDATYSVIQGTSSAYPTLTQPAKQVIIGYIKWPSMTASITGATYTKADSANFNADSDIVRRNLPQTIPADKNIYNATQMAAKLVYDSTNLILNAATDRNFYTIDEINVSTYLEVEDFSFPFATKAPITNEVRNVTVYTNQRLRISASDSIVLGNTNGTMNLDKGDTFTVVDVTKVVGPSVYRTYYILKGGEVRKDTVSKLYGQLIYGKGTGYFDDPNASFVLDRKGNLYDITMDFGVVGVAYIIGNDQYTNANVATHSSGGIVRIRVIDNAGSGRKLTLINIIGGVYAGYKQIDTLLGEDMLVSDGDIITFLETSNSYVVLSVSGTDINLVKLYKQYHSLTQTEEKIYTKTQSTSWKILANSAFNSTNGVLTLTNDANSYEVNVPTGDLNGILKDIKIDHGSGVSDVAPNGLIVNIRFKHINYVAGISQPFYIAVTGFNMRSTVSEAVMTNGGDTDKIYIQSDIYSQGDIYTFRKTNGVWDLIGMNLLPRIMSRILSAEAQLSILYSTNWNNVALINSYIANSNTYPPTYAKRSANTVVLRGSGKIVVFASNGNFGTLPAGFRPLQEVRLPIAVIANGSSGTGYLVIDVSGNMTANTTLTIGSGTFIFYMDGSSFSTS